MISAGNKVLTTLIGLLVTASMLTGCLGSEDVADEREDELEDWNVFLVASSMDLPSCDDSTDGRLYYVSSENEFQACSLGLWSVIDIAGADGADGAIGPQGPAGADGADGEDGQDGEQGPQGPAGADGADGEDGQDGTSFTIIGVVENSSDLGEIYIGDVGDAFLVNSTAHIHVWNGDSWVDLGNISGPEGPIGIPGEVGPTGAEGPTGASGLNALIATEALAVGGLNCPQGGHVVRIGMDDDSDGFLSTLEVDQTLYVCDGVNGIDGNDGADGADGADGVNGSMPIVMETVVTVSGMKFYIDGIQQAEVGLYRGFTYTFEQSASSNSAHPLRFSTTDDGTHGGGSQYTDGITYTGTQGSNGLLTFTVPLDAPDNLYYYCQNHANMGGVIQILSLGYVDS